ncbi:HAD family hydrolase [Tabrizicola aquatica]|uniref:HAD family hydrolase n=1 Tax=Tabrizicola aquatica TaxID=909926 RepID=UPI000CD1FD6D|nr:HAD family phosphatase [Tabrizicola aquatica]
MTRPKAVLFDCDGVIVDSEAVTLDMLRADFAAHGLILTPTQLETDFVGGTIETVATRARAAGASLPEGWVADFYARLYATLDQGTPLIPGILTVFDRLDQAGIPYAVGSNGPLQKMRISLGQHGLIPRFRTILSGQTLGRPKPAPDVYLAAAAACGANPSACVVIEDSASGAQAALAAGIPCLGYIGHGPDTPPARQLAALGLPLFRSMAELPNLLDL